MYKIVHLATGETVKDFEGNDLVYFSEMELYLQVMENRDVVFVKSVEEDNDTIQALEVYRVPYGYHNKYIVPKFQFEVVEDIGVWNV